MNSVKQRHDDYMTPRSAWEAIAHLIPRDRVIWEPFYGDGQSGEDLRSLGFEVIHQDIDFYKHDLGQQIVSNPPYSDTKNIIPRLKELGKPFILIMPCQKLGTLYFRNVFKDEGIQIIIPRKRIHFKKLVDGVEPEGHKSSCNFDCFYYCWKMGFEHDINWL